MSLVQEYLGRSGYASDVTYAGQLMFVTVGCRLGALPDRLDALLDTAAEWCVLTLKVATELGLLPIAGSEPAVLSSRYGTLRGELVRIGIEFPAAEGMYLQVDATWFVSEEWPGPLVIGWRGCLERFRFALDRGDESFYFAEL
jgi:hypothetical protein